MGVKNGPSVFQRMMQWVLKGIESVHIYLDDLIIGSTGATEEELVENHRKRGRSAEPSLMDSNLLPAMTMK